MQQIITANFSNDELIMLNNALNEISNGISITEFQARVGYTREEVEGLMSKIAKLIEHV